MDAILLSIATFFSTSFGGFFSLRFKHKLHLIMGFTAGVLIGVFSFDIFPEIISQVQSHNYNPTGPMVAFVAGFMLFHIVEKLILIHHAHEDEYADHKHPHIGILSGLALAGHSFMDGVGIGLGFQISPAVGFLVAIAVLAHDFTDGMNTVTLVLTHNNPAHRARQMLFVDALAPVLGVVATKFFTVPEYALTLYLAFFGGFLMYIGASDILPEAHSKHSSFKLIALTLLGIALIFVVTRFV